MKFNHGDIVWIKAKIDHASIEIQLESKDEVYCACSMEELNEWLEDDVREGTIVKHDKPFDNQIKKQEKKMIQNEIKNLQDKIKNLEKKLSEM